MSQTVSEVMATRKASALEQIKNHIWAGATEKAIEIAISNGISGSEVERIQKEVDQSREAIEAGNSVNLAELKKAVTACEKIEAEKLAKLEEVQADYGDAFRQSQAARDALSLGNNAVHKLAAMMTDGQVPVGIEPSASVKSVMAENSAQAATEKRRAELKVNISKMRESIDRVENQLSAASHSLSREGSFNKDVSALEKRLAALKKEHAGVVCELSKLQ